MLQIADLQAQLNAANKDELLTVNQLQALEYQIQTVGRKTNNVLVYKNTGPALMAGLFPCLATEQLLTEHKTNV